MIEKIKSVFTSKSFLTIGVSVLGATTIVFASLFTWKAVTNNSNQYTVTWDLGNGKTIEEKYQIGEMPSYKGETPSKPDDTEYDEDRIKYHYTFNGWQEDLVPVVKDTTYHVNYLKESLYFLIKIVIPAEYFEPTVLTLDPFQDETEDKDITIDWGDEDATADQHSHSHTYNTPGTKCIKIHSSCKSLYFASENPEMFARIKALIRSVTLPYGWTVVGKSAEYEKEMFTDIPYFDAIILPTTITRIQQFSDAQYDYDYKTKINHLVIHNGVKTIAENAFNFIILPDALVIPESVTEIERYAFKNSHISRIVLPKTITNYSSFSLCFGNDNPCIFDFTAYDTPPTIAHNVFFEYIAAEMYWKVKVRQDTYQEFLDFWNEALDMDPTYIAQQQYIFY